MNFKTTIGLLVLLIALGGFFYYLERTSPAPTEDEGTTTAAAQGKAVFKAGDLSSEGIDTIAVEIDGQTTVMRKKGMEWTETEPVEFPVNSYTVREALDAAAGLRYTDHFTPGQKENGTLAELGLSPAKATITLKAGGLKPVEHTLKLGRDLPGAKAYVMVDADPKAYIVGDGLQRLVLDKNIWTWRQQKIIAPGEAQADRVTLASEGGRPVEVVKADGAWSLGSPYSGRVDRPAVQALLSAVNSIYIGEFVADAPADLSVYGLDKPRTVLTVQSTPPAPAAGTQPEKAAAPTPTVNVLRIGGPTDLRQMRYYATWSNPGEKKPVVFTLAKTEAEKFNKSVDDLRDARVTPIKYEDVHELTLSTAVGSTIRLERGATGGWDFKRTPAQTAPAGTPAFVAPAFPADHGQVAELVENLAQTKAVGYEADYQAKDPAVATVELGAVGKAQPDVLRVFNSADKAAKQYVVLRNNETTGYRVPAEKLTEVFDSPLALRDRQVLHLDADRLTKIQIHQADGLELVFTRTVGPKVVPQMTVSTQPIEPVKPSAWVLQGQVKFEQGDLESLIEQTTSLRAESWVTRHGSHREPESIQAPGLSSESTSPSTNKADEGAVVVTLTSAEGTPVVITIDPATRTTSATGVDSPFMVTPGLLDAAGAEFRYRTVLNITHEQIKRVTITRRNKSLALEMDEENRYFSPTVKEKIDQSTAGGIIDSLAGLRAVRFVAPLKPVPETYAVSVEILGKDDSKHVLDIYGPSGGGVYTAHMDDRWFTIEEDTVLKLEADPTAPGPSMPVMPPMPPRMRQR